MKHSTDKVAPLTLNSEIPEFALDEGLRAHWCSPETAECDGRGVCEIVDNQGVVVLDELVDTPKAARAWLNSTDWNELANAESGSYDVEEH